jgi:hypothetical protein
MSGTSIYTNNQIYDVKPLPNGDLLVASAYQIDEITTSGSFDLFLTSDGELLVGSRTQIPHFFDLDLDDLGALDGQQQMFVTQYTPVPEPGTLAYLATFGIGLILRQRRRHKRINPL